MKKLLPYLIFAFLVTSLGILSGLNNLPGEWYQSLAKPAFNPPNWIFAPVWTVLYVLIGIAGARIWIFARTSIAMILWIVQLVLNLLWSPAFFGQQNLLLGLIVIIPLLLTIFAFIAVTWRRERTASVLFLPYAAWVAFATLLNMTLFLLNR